VLETIYILTNNILFNIKKVIKMNKKITCLVVVSLFLLTGLTLTSSANSPPAASTPSGQTIILFRNKVRYTCSATDPDGDKVYLMLYHPKNVTAMQQTKWYGPYGSGEEVQITFDWWGHNPDKYYLKLKAKDTSGAIDESTALEVKVGFEIDSKNTNPVRDKIQIRFLEYPLIKLLIKFGLNQGMLLI
jgi:hypothetical protein